MQKLYNLTTSHLSKLATSKDGWVGIFFYPQKEKPAGSFQHYCKMPALGLNIDITGIPISNSSGHKKLYVRKCVTDVAYF